MTAREYPGAYDEIQPDATEAEKTPACSALKVNGGGSGGSAGAAMSTLVSHCAAEIKPQKIEWLWPGRIARGKHTAIAGEPGAGKSQLSIAITAAVTTGGPWPCDEGRSPIGNVIILSGAADTMRRP
jgi:putative DNA primase/helicase